MSFFLTGCTGIFAIGDKKRLFLVDQSTDKKTEADKKAEADKQAIDEKTAAKKLIRAKTPGLGRAMDAVKEGAKADTGE